MPHVSVLTTLYCSAPYIEELYERTRASLAKITDDYEFVFVDDGSPDDSKKLVEGLIEKDGRVRLVELSRNFGHHKAVMEGLAHTAGDYVFLFDSDLEEEPELLERFYAIMQENPEGTDVVYGYMEERKGSIFEKIPGWIFYRLINFMSDVPIPKDMMAARLMKRGYVDNLLKFGESHVFLGGIMALNGYRQVGVPAAKGSKGSTTYSWGIKVANAVDALVSFSNKPLTYVAVLGIAISSVSFVVTAYLVARLLIYDVSIDGWMLVLASLWFLGGLILSAIGLVGFYVGRVFLQVKDRPNTIVRKVYN